MESRGHAVPDQIVEILDYDPAWVERFVEQRARLDTLLAPWLGGPVEHVGSTSVPGLPAKPIVDILAPVKSLSDAEAALPALAGEGWLFWPEDPNRHYRLWLLRPQPTARTHHLQLIEQDHPDATALIAFRDALRRDDALRASYAALKERLAAQYRTDRNAYSNAKADFVRSVLRPRGYAASSRKPV
jgi:GrpB-like predicted nucleotidyltransferase (UPF0157 family)